MTDEYHILKYTHGAEYEEALKDVITLLEEEDTFYREREFEHPQENIPYGHAWVVIYHLKKAIYQAMNCPPPGALE